MRSSEPRQDDEGSTQENWRACGKDVTLFEREVNDISPEPKPVHRGSQGPRVRREGVCARSPPPVAQQHVGVPLSRPR